MPALAPAREDRNLAVRLGVAVPLFLLLVGQAQVTVLDGSSMLAVARSIVHDGTLAVPPRLGVAGHDGLFYSKYGLALVQFGIQSLIDAGLIAKQPVDPLAHLVIGALSEAAVVNSAAKAWPMAASICGCTASSADLTPLELRTRTRPAAGAPCADKTPEMAPTSATMTETRVACMGIRYALTTKTPTHTSLASS